MNNEVEYIEPTQEHVGQMVEVRDGGGAGWNVAKLVAIVEHMYKFVAFPKDGIPCGYRKARIARPLTYADRQARCGLKVGDRVRIVSLPKSYEAGWADNVLPMMAKLVGSVHAIKSFTALTGFRVGGFNWPYFVLEKVEDRVATHLDIGAKVYVTGSPEDEFELTHVFRNVGEVGINDTFAVVRSSDKRFVYELSNLRVKE